MDNRIDSSREPLLTVNDLVVEFGRAGAWRRAVNGVSFTIAAGERLALVGESGSGKSVTALSLLKLLPPKSARYPRGHIEFQGQNVLAAPSAALRKIRGRQIAMVFQEPMTSLNPVLTIGRQLTEPLQLHEGMSARAARDRAIELLARMGIAQPRARLDAHPHMLSGGQRQRVMIAMALACNPRLLVADEPTTALDVTVQWQILQLLDELQREFNMAVLLISHDLNLVSHFAERVCVMHRGEIVEQGLVDDVYSQPRTQYTQELLASRLDRMLAPELSPEPVAQNEDEPSGAPLLSGRGLQCQFTLRGGMFRRRLGTINAVNDVDFDVEPGRTLGIVGESGSGKTTLAQCLLRLQGCEGQIVFAGQRLDGLRSSELRPLRAQMQVVFQDPYSSLSPRMTVERIVGEGLVIHQPQLSRGQRREKVVAILREVGIEEDVLERYPHEFSGGQRQRIAIARAVILSPRLLVLDEPTSALDATVQKQVLELLVTLQQRYGLTYILITHDLSVIRAVAHRVVVMKDGKLVESSDAEAFLRAPQTEYGRQLLGASLIDSRPSLIKQKVSD